MFPARGSNVQGLPANEIHARHDEMQLHTPTLGVAMSHPGNVPLLGVEAGKSEPFELIHRHLLMRVGGGILWGKRQNTVGVRPLPAHAVDQVTGAAHVPPNDLWRRMVSALRTGQVFRDLPPATTPAPGELNQHLGTSHGQP